MLSPQVSVPFPAGTIYSFAPGTPHFIYSNFHPTSVSYEGLTYPSSEHAFQASKTLDHDLRMYILRLPTAAASKKAGGAISIREDWDAIRFRVMEEILRVKFSFDSKPGNILMHTGNVLMVEGNYWHDRTWGQCYCPRHIWEGENHLGKLLMKIRGELQTLKG